MSERESLFPPLPDVPDDAYLERLEDWPDQPAIETVEAARRRAIGRLNDWISTMPTSPGKTQALIDLNVILTADRESEAGVGRLRDDEWLGDTLHTIMHPGHPWSGCTHPDPWYKRAAVLRAALSDTAEDAK